MLLSELQNICRQLTIGRDPSHGLGHMLLVTSNTSHIIDKMDISNKTYLNRIAIAVAMMHDVADHKYVKDPIEMFELIKTQLQEIGYTEDESEFIVLACDNVSFSKERDNKINWDKLDEFPNGCLIRDIVSDADKLEAIGAVGIERCYQYSREKCEQNGDEVTEDELWAMVHKHADEKLLILKDKYIRTKEGYELAEPLHKEMLDILEEH